MNSHGIKGKFDFGLVTGGVGRESGGQERGNIPDRYLFTEGGVGFNFEVEDGWGLLEHKF